MPRGEPAHAASARGRRHLAQQTRPGQCVGPLDPQPLDPPGAVIRSASRRDSAHGLLQGEQAEGQEQTATEPVEHLLADLLADPLAGSHRQPGDQGMAAQGARQQRAEGERGRRGKKDGGELGAISQLGDEHQREGFPDHCQRRGDPVAALGRLNGLFRISGLSRGSPRCHGLGVDQQLDAEAEKQRSCQPRHHAGWQQFPQAIAHAQRDERDGREGRKGTDEHPAGPMAGRQDQGHEEGLVAQLGQGDGREAGAESSGPMAGEEGKRHALNDTLNGSEPRRRGRSLSSQVHAWLLCMNIPA